MRPYRALSVFAALALVVLTSPPCRAAEGRGTAIPLPEHPRPDFERAAWVNLNGDWSFRFDPADAGEAERWFDTAPAGFPLAIRVPFPWGSKLSGVGDEADVAWYARTVRVPEAWKGQRVFLVVGASDWKTSGVARRGADRLAPGRLHAVRARAHEGREAGEGRSGSSSGWTTRRTRSSSRASRATARPAASGRPSTSRPGPRSHLDTIEFHPDPALEARRGARGGSPRRRPRGLMVELKVRHGRPRGPLLLGGAGPRRGRRPRGPRDPAPRRAPRLWSLEDPFLYDATVTLAAGGAEDRVDSPTSACGRSASRDLPGLGHPYVSLNGKPVYLQMTLDQSWNPDGF